MREAGGRASRTTARCEGMANGQLTEVEAGLVEDRDEYEARHLEDNVEHLVRPEPVYVAVHADGRAAGQGHEQHVEFGHLLVE